MLLHPSPCLSRPQEPQTTDPSVEHLIGDLIAATACLFAQSLGEYWARGKMNGQMSADTKAQGRALIAALLELRNGTVGELHFNAVARSHGARVLKDRYGQGVSDKTLKQLAQRGARGFGSDHPCAVELKIRVPQNPNDQATGEVEPDAPNLLDQVHPVDPDDVRPTVGH